MTKKYLVCLVGIGLCVLIFFMGGARGGKGKLSALKDFCDDIKETVSDSVHWHYIIYLNINACLTCHEDLTSWRKLEEDIPRCNGSMTFWAPREDSADVAIALDLEGFSTPVRVLDPRILDELDMANCGSPIKLLLNKDCKLKAIEGPLEAADAREFDKKILDIICGGE